MALRETPISIPPRLERLLAAIGYALLTALAFPGLALWRGTAAYHDLATHHLPWRLWTADQWLSGNLPLWNPLSANGFPMLAEPQVGALYPPNLLFGLIDPFAALNITILTHAWLAGFGAFLFARNLGLTRPGAALTGTVWGASGFLVTHVVYLPMLHSMAWLPLLMLAIDRFLQHARARTALAATACAALMVLAGHPQAAVLGALLAATYFIYRLALGYPEGPPRHQRLARGWRLAIALAFSVLLVLPQIVATLELAGESERAGGVEMSFAAQGALPIQEVVNLALPRTFGYERPADLPIAHHHHGELYWGNGETYWENAFFVGIPALLLALLAIAARPKGLWFFVAWIPVALLLMVGPGTPLYAIWRLLPGADLLRFPARFALILTFSLAVLSGFGLDAWLRHLRDRTRRYRLVTRGLVILLAASWALSGILHIALVRNADKVEAALEDRYDRKLDEWRQLYADPPPGIDTTALPPPPEGGEAPLTIATLYDGDDYYGHKVDRMVAELKADTHPFGSRVLLPLGMALAVLALLPLAARNPHVRWAVVLLAVIDLLAFVSGFMPAVPWDEARAEPETVPVLVDDDASRVAVVHRLVPLGLCAEMVGASDNLRFDIAEVSIPSPLRVLRQYALVLDAGLGLEPIEAERRAQQVAERIDTVRALGVTHLQSTAELPAPFERIHAGAVNVYRVPDAWSRATLHDSLAADVDALRQPLASLPVTTDEAGLVEVDTSGQGAGVLTVTETAYPGWQVTVDGEPADLQAMAGGLLAVDLPADATTVSFRYRPTTVLVTLAAFPLLWLLWAVWFGMSCARMGRRRGENP